MVSSSTEGTPGALQTRAPTSVPTPRPPACSSKRCDRRGNQCRRRATLPPVSNLGHAGALACLFSTLLISCGSGKEQASGPRAPAASAPAREESPPAPVSSAPEEAAPSAPSGHLSIGPLTLRNERGHGLELASDGTVSKLPGGEPVGKLGPDGQFVLASGRPGPRLEPDGHVVAANGQSFPVRIAEDGSVEAPNSAPVRFDDAGRLVGGNPDAPKTEVSGLTPTLRRTAAFLLILAAFPVRQ
jgi:hypothetical protein